MVTGRVARRGDVFLVELTPTRGREIQRARPCLVVSPDERNRHLSTDIIAPRTAAGNPYPFRVACRFQGKTGPVVLDLIRPVDRERLVRKLGHASPRIMTRPLQALQGWFAS